MHAGETMSSKIQKLREMPAYPFVEAAHYLHIPVATLRAWCVGYNYQGGSKRFKPVIRLDGKKADGLSFLNLVEAHVLSAIRRQHQIPLPKIRHALDYVAKHLKLNRPLWQAQFDPRGQLVCRRTGSRSECVARKASRNG